MSASASNTVLSWSERPGRELLRLAWPITISTLSYATMTLASTAFVARVGSDELAGVGLGAVVGFAILCFGVGLLRGGKTLVSQAVGADRRDRLPELLGAALAIAVSLGVLGILVAQVAAPIVATLSASPRAGQFASVYLSVRLLGAPLMLAYAALREASYGVGDTRTPMRAAIAGNAMNIALDAVLILGLGWGVAGAALATIAGNATELLVLGWPMWPKLRAARLRVASIKALWREGVPNGLQFVMEVGAFLLLTIMVARMSAVDGAAHQLVMHLINVSFLPAHALAEATAVLVGQAVGANRDDLVKRIAYRALSIGAAYSGVCVVVYASLGSVITSAMAAGDTVLAERSLVLLHVGLAFLTADAANVIARGALRGASDVRYAAVVGIITSWVTTPPLAYLLGIHWGLGVMGGWIGLAIEITAGSLIFWLRVRHGGWRPAAAAARRALAGTAV